jgi:hypothetical protein
VIRRISSRPTEVSGELKTGWHRIDLPATFRSKRAGFYARRVAGYSRRYWTLGEPGAEEGLFGVGCMGGGQAFTMHSPERSGSLLLGASNIKTLHRLRLILHLMWSDSLSKLDFDLPKLRGKNEHKCNCSP